MRQFKGVFATSVVPGPVGMSPLCHLLGCAKWPGCPGVGGELKITVVFPNGVVETSQFQDVEEQKKR